MSQLPHAMYYVLEVHDDHDCYSYSFPPNSTVIIIKTTLGCFISKMDWLYSPQPRIRLG